MDTCKSCSNIRPRKYPVSQLVVDDRHGHAVYHGRTTVLCPDRCPLLFEQSRSQTPVGAHASEYDGQHLAAVDPGNR